MSWLRLPCNGWGINATSALRAFVESRRMWGIMPEVARGPDCRQPGARATTKAVTARHGTILPISAPS